MRSCTVSESVLFVDTHVFVYIQVCGMWGRECLSTNLGVCMCVYMCAECLRVLCGERLCLSTGARDKLLACRYVCLGAQYRVEVVFMCVFVCDWLCLQNGG